MPPRPSSDFTSYGPSFVTGVTDMLERKNYSEAGSGIMRFVVIGVALVAAACTPVPEAPERGPAPAAAQTSAAFPNGKLIDLSHTYDQTTVFWPTAETFRLDKVSDGMTPGGYYYAANNFFSSEHGGTHLDAPVHFAKGAQTVDRIPLERLVGAAYVVDVVAKANENADYQIGVQDFEAAERAQGPIGPDSIVLLRTGFSDRWPDAQRYLGTADRGGDAASRLHFP